MRIKSGFTDYMDGICKSDGDYQTLWLRETQEAECRIRTLLPKQFDIRIFEWADIIGFAGELYPCRRYSYGYGKQPIITPDYYSWYEFKKIDYDAENWPRKWYHFGYDRYVGHLNNPEFKDFLFQTYGPSFMIFANGHKIVINPRLESLGMAKVLPPQQAYMNIYRYLCNQKNPERPIPEMSNDIKVEQAGFDLKTSFRKEKSKKK